ncbi:MAG: hypothetical protein ABFD64_13760 [Armatimonadota bacterium]
MTTQKARPHVGTDCTAVRTGRLGSVQTVTTHIHQSSFIPFYGAYLAGDIEDVCLDKAARRQYI